jgi:phospholipase/carboxylesterase
MRLIKTSLIHQVAPFDESQTGLHPTLILLHGRGANEDDLLGLVPYLSPQLLCIAPRAPLDFTNGGYTWYELREVGSPNLDQFNRSYDLLVQFLEDVEKQYPVDPRQIFLLGFSMGTVMAYSLALTKPEKIRGVVAHSGYVPENTSLQLHWNNLSNTSFFVAHGIYDPVIPIQYGRKANELLTKSKADLVYREYPIQHQISDDSLRDLSTWLNGRLERASHSGPVAQN